LYDLDISAQKNLVQEDRKSEPEKPTFLSSKMFAKKNFDGIKF